MQESDRAELERLKESHARLQAQLAALSQSIAGFEQRLERAAELIAPAPPPPGVAPETPIPVTAPPLSQSTVEALEAPPIISEYQAAKPGEAITPPAPTSAPAEPPPIAVIATEGIPKEGFRRCSCALCTGAIDFSANELGRVVVCPHCGQLTRLTGVETTRVAPPEIPEPAGTAVESASVAGTTESSTPPPPPPPSEGTAREKTSPEPKGSFEMRLGTYWLVRVGIVMLLTAAVFFANYAYQNFFVRLGPPGKVVLLYLVSFGLLGAGAWWQRKSVKESLKNYAQVLFAGGLAGVYFTTYAAHHIQNLLVIRSALLDGVLLFMWAAFIAWIADRRKSEVLALFAVGLAYYTSVITRVGAFTLYSNLVLTLAALFFLVRNRWAALSFASLVATYASYAYWRFFHGGEGWRWATPEEGLWFGACFLFSYWIVFTAAAFLSKDEKLARQNRAGFLTFNNGAMFALFVLTMVQVRHGGFWKFCLIYGSVLLLLNLLARRLLPDEPLTRNAYLTQGLVLVTLGFVSKYSGLQLALVLAAQSVVLFVLSTQRKNVILEFASYISGAMAVGWSIDGLERDDTRGVWLGSALGAMMAFNALWSNRKTADANRVTPRAVPAYFTALALTIWFFTTWQNVEHEHIGLALAIEALVFTLSIYLLRLPEIPSLGQLYVLVAQLAWLWSPSNTVAQCTALLLAANSVAVLWQGRRRNATELEASGYISAALAVAWGIFGLERNALSGLLTGAALALTMMMQAYFAHRQSRATDQVEPRAAPSYFSVLVILLALTITWFNTSRAHCPLWLTAEALALTATIYVLRVRELTLLGQLLPIAGHFAWQYNLATVGTPPWWNPVLMIGMTLGLGHWWQKQKVIGAETRAPFALQFILSLLLVVLICAWLGKRCDDATWLALSCALAVGVTAYAAATRAWLLALCAQLFFLPAGWLFLNQTASHGEPRFATLAPIAALGVLSFAAVQWFKRKPDANEKVRDPLLTLALAYRWTALAMSLWWVMEYIPRQEHIWTFALIGFAVFGFAGWKRSREALLFGAVFTAVGLIIFWVRSGEYEFVYLPNLLAMVALLAQQRIARRLPARYSPGERIHTALIWLGGLSVWRYVTVWVELGASGFYLTASWSALALVIFLIGIVLRERMYRWVGLAILTGALGRVVIFDVWELETIFRVLSFAALGIVLLVLGFIYNKYQEKIRQWL